MFSAVSCCCNSSPNLYNTRSRLVPAFKGAEGAVWLSCAVACDDKVARSSLVLEDTCWEGDVFDRTSVNDRIQLVHNNIQTSFKEISITGDFDGDGLVEWVLGRSDAETLTGTDSGDFFVIKGFSEVYD